MDLLPWAVFELARIAVAVPALLLWERGWWGRIAAIVYVVGLPAASAYVAVTVTPPPLPWGWLPYGILLVWAANLLEALGEAIGDGLRGIWRRIRKAPGTALPGGRPDPAGRPGRRASASRSDTG
ncbi:MAG: hypothetical protein IRZ05_01315 [Micromonosporaceae bacterium]|nr:hypothetical protein [Micromonosporaceae bacterium]